jgi:hypothetical protein
MGGFKDIATNRMLAAEAQGVSTDTAPQTVEPQPAAQQLVRYDAMCAAIEAAYQVDEVKDIRDKALAIETYTRLAHNTEAERQACMIRLRAERKAGQLLRDMEKAKGVLRQGVELPRSTDTTTGKTLAELGVSKDQSSNWQKLADIPEEQFEAALADVTTKPTTSGIINAAKPFAPPWTGDFERYTPPEYLAAARAALGSIDLDPASNAIAQQVVRARQYFTSETDGLTQEWRGRVWLNPPYHRDLLSAFVAKLLTELGAGRVSEAVMLTNNCTDTDWFLAALNRCAAICFTHGRIKFMMPDGSQIGTPTHGQAFFYFGGNVTGFARAFRGIGFGFIRCWSLDEEATEPVEPSICALPSGKCRGYDACKPTGKCQAAAPAASQARH